MLKNVVFSALKKRWLACVALLSIVLGIMLLSLAPAYILQGLIDRVLLGGGGMKTLLFYAIAYFSVLGLAGLFELLKQVLLVVIGENIMLDIRKCLAQKLKTIEAIYFSNIDSGQITSVFSNDVDAINTMFTEGLISMVIDLLKIVGIVISMFVFSYVLGLITLAIIPIIYLISHVFKRKMFAAQMRNRKLIGIANNHIGQSVNTRQMIKVYGLERYMSDKYYALLTDNYKAVESVNFFDSIYSPIIKTMTALVIAGVIVLSSVNISALGITIGMLAGGITLIESLFAPIENIGMELQSLQSAMSGIHRVSDFLEQRDELAKRDLTLADMDSDSQVAMAFEHLSFAYNENNTIIRDLNFTINRGEKVAIVGRTGVGKTTLFKLITGLIKGEGRITLGGVDVYDIPSKLKPYLFGYVEQSFSAVSGSIRDNVTLGNDIFTTQDVLNALDYVMLGEVVNSLDNGIDTLFDKSLFSQGQLQLLAIARAIIYDPQVLLLDEITANLDSNTERKILEILDKASENRTILSISHRQSTIIDCDRIITLESGRVKDIKVCKDN